MFYLANRRYTGAKIKLLDKIDSALVESFDYTKGKNLSFFDVFAGTGVVSEFFMQTIRGYFISKCKFIE